MGDSSRSKRDASGRMPPYEALERRVRDLDEESRRLKGIDEALEKSIDKNHAIVESQTEFKRIHESLEKSEQHYRNFLETMSEGFGQVDENLVRVYANSKLCEMLGYERGELVGQSVLTLLDETNKKIMLEQASKRKKGEAGSYEITMKKKNGQDLHVILSPFPQFDEKGVFRGSYSVVRDITKLKQTEQALKDREDALDRKRIEIAEANVALKTLLKIRHESIQELEEDIVSNFKQTVKPYLRQLKRAVGEKERVYIRKIESNLDSVLSPLAKNLASKHLGLTPTELRVATLVKDGNSSKEIASLLNVSQRTVDFHRRNIRKKLGIENAKANLRARLISIK